jgi:hypothetical protein
VSPFLLLLLLSMIRHPISPKSWQREHQRQAEAKEKVVEEQEGLPGSPRQTAMRRHPAKRLPSTRPRLPMQCRHLHRRPVTRRPLLAVPREPEREREQVVATATVARRAWFA